MTLMLPSELDSAAMFDGLPPHPLVVHLPVVVLPLTAILLVGRAGQVAATEAADTASSSASAPASEAGTSAAPRGQAETGAYSMAEVSTHDSAESCWFATESLCGSDGTEAFTAQHDGNTRVAEQLSEFRIGQLAS